MLRASLQLGLIHMAVAMTLVPINGTLNRVMIKELGLSATLVVALASLPYLFSPIQVAIGAYSDRHPLFGRRRSPYILAGLLLCAVGVAAAPYCAYLMAGRFWLGLLAGAASFSAWGMGYNLAAVSYLALATELSGKGGRGRTLAVMWCLMIGGIIATSLGLGRLLDPYSPAVLTRSFAIVAGAALLIGLAGLPGLEKRTGEKAPPQGNAWGSILRGAAKNPQALLFFVYLLLLLSAVFGQDLLLEPFAGEVLKLSIAQTTRVSSIWGGSFLAAMLLGSALERLLAKKTLAYSGGLAAFLALMILLASGLLASRAVFYSGTILLGLGTGVSTIANLSLMMDMTVTGNEGAFIGLWGIASALSRVAGSATGGLARDLAGRTNPLRGYLVVFALLGLFLAISLFLLGRIDTPSFLRKAHRSLFPADPGVLENLD
jgi:BCD family chlorophyll transporter-like MFS transporter